MGSSRRLVKKIGPVKCRAQNNADNNSETEVVLSDVMQVDEQDGGDFDPETGEAIEQCAAEGRIEVPILMRITMR